MRSKLVVTAIILITLFAVFLGVLAYSRHRDARFHGIPKGTSKERVLEEFGEPGEKIGDVAGVSVTCDTKDVVESWIYHHRFTQGHVVLFDKAGRVQCVGDYFVWN